MRTSTTSAARVAVGLIIREGGVLLGRRATGRPYGGMWALPGGHIEPGEAARDAVLRELHEALGIRAFLAGNDPEAVSMIGSVERSVWLVSSWQGVITNRAPDEQPTRGGSPRQICRGQPWLTRKMSV
jgi:8-oxo-dGTP diphosphatase